MPKNIVIILSAGKGIRMGINTPKQFLLLNNKPVICHTIEKFQNCNKIDEIIVVMAEDYMDFFKNEIIKGKNYTKITKIILGGDERFLSAFNGIKAIEETNSIVLIHDSVRPFIESEYIEKIINTTLTFGACILATKVKDTVKVCKDEFITNTPKRDLLWLAQTPQAFKYDLIKKAYEKAIKENINVTDDAEIVENMGVNVKIILGDYKNVKITTLEDLEISEYILNKKK